jgi:DNA-binding NtrC family response regulator
VATPVPSTLVDGGRSLSGAALGYHLTVMGPDVFETVELPARGEVVLGRGAGVDVPLDEPRASRRHARLRVGDAGFEIEDLGSANGTRVRGRRLEAKRAVPIVPGEAIAIGALTLMVQPNRAPTSAARPVLSHDDFEGRVAWECARAEATGGGFSVARVRAPGAPTSPARDGLRAVDLVGRRGRGELELLLPGLVGPAALVAARTFAKAVGGRAADVSLATYPRDGRSAPALLTRAGTRDDVVAERDADAVTCVEESMRRLYALAHRAAEGTIGVVILGETGVGKDVLARAIHEHSPRASRPFVSINCAALTEALLESELFGHERGAFTGAAGAKAGLLETAPGGTVFLDEVGELPPAVQAKLLRVLETRELVRVGGVRAQKIDVRFLAATNRDLEADVARGAFRRDLYYRLNGMTLTIPPLRERPRDLPLLARHFVAAFSEAAGRSRPPALSDDALARLAAHDWPGNVRELRNVVERALLLADGPVIEAEHLGEDTPRAPAPAPKPSRSRPPASERSRILEALAACGGNQSRAAKQLGISRKVLLARLDTYGVARPRKKTSR